MSRLYDLFRIHPHVSTDSRRTEPGSLFFALRGASFDGNRFAADALARGAAFAVVDDPAVAATDSRMICVGDALTALQTLAREHRRTLGIPLLALTGSNGKTTTKELVSRVLAARFRVYATRGNLNNHIGVPLTLLAMTGDTDFGVVEMGASAQGEIALLCQIAQPDYGLVTNIGRAHLDGFGGPEGVRRGKGELFDYLAAHGGRAFVPEDDATLVSMASERPSLAAISYSCTLADGMEHHLEGTYNRTNIAAAVAVGHYFGIAEASIRRAVAAYAPDNHRSQRIETGRNTVVADCYNANPSSMQAALENFRAEALGNHCAKVLILGDMLELGHWSSAEHARIVQLALSIEGAQLLLVGEAFAAVCRASGHGTTEAGALPVIRPLHAADRIGCRSKEEAIDPPSDAAGFRTPPAATDYVHPENPPAGPPEQPPGSESPVRPAPVLRAEKAPGLPDLADPGTAARIQLFPSRDALEAYLAARPLEGALVLVKGSHGMGLEKTLDLL